MESISSSNGPGFSLARGPLYPTRACLTLACPHIARFQGVPGPAIARPPDDSGGLTGDAYRSSPSSNAKGPPTMCGRPFKQHICKVEQGRSRLPTLLSPSLIGGKRLFGLGNLDAHRLVTGAARGGAALNDLVDIGGLKGALVEQLAELLEFVKREVL